VWVASGDIGLLGAHGTERHGSRLAIPPTGEDPVAHQRSTPAYRVPPTDSDRRTRPDRSVALTRAEAHALRRSAPLKPVQVKPLRRPVTPASLR
jgi:hypothetical protein